MGLGKLLRGVFGFIVNLIWAVVILLGIFIIINLFRAIVLEEVAMREVFSHFGHYALAGIKEAIDFFANLFKSTFQSSS